jgi:hypothetical protein
LDVPLHQRTADNGWHVSVRRSISAAASSVSLATHQLRSSRHATKLVHHPIVGDLALNCDVLEVPDRDQHMVILTAEPGTPSDQAMRLLKVVGTQRMDASI